MKSDILKRFIYVLAFSALLVTAVAAGDLRLPSFLPDYYGRIQQPRRPLAFVTQRETNSVTQCLYSLGATRFFPSRASAAMARPAAQVLTTSCPSEPDYHHEQRRFVEITETESHAEAVLTNVTQTIFAFVLPHSVNIWTTR